MSKKLTDEEIIASLESEERMALDSSTGVLAEERADALDRYRGAPLGNEVEGRSQVVDRSVMDTIEWIMPSLARIFFGGDEIGKFEPIGPEDEEGAKQDTDVCNWYLQNRGDFFSQGIATLKDALLLKNGYMVCVWQKKYDTMTETYEGLSIEEAQMLLQDKEVQLLEHTEVPTGEIGQDGQPVSLHDIKVEQKKCDEFPEPESVPPDEIIVSRRHRWTSLLDADFVEWVRRNVTIGQLRAEGFDIPDDVMGDDASSLESTSRDRFESNPFNSRQDETNDPSRRVVTFRDAYIRMDLRGSGTPQLWRIARISGAKTITLKEEANIIPFAAFSPIIYPHSHIGMSVYDLIADLGIIKTTLQRQYLDGLYLQTSGRMGVDINKIVNMDDLLVSRPGGIVRTDGHPSESLYPIVAADTSAAALGGLEYMEAQKEGRTGVTRYSAGLDANTLNKTATGVQAIQAAANQRIELLARTLAGGFKDLFRIMHTLAAKHSTKSLQIKLNGKWAQVDPRRWKTRTDFTVSVGLGTGTPEQQMQKLLMLAPMQQQAMTLGLAGPLEAYNLGAEIWKAAGFKVHDRFIKPPKMQPKKDQQGQPVMGPDGQPQMEPVQPPPQKDPLVQAQEVKTQGETQVAQMKMQGDQQAKQAELALKPQEMQMEIQKAQAEGQIKIAIARETAQIEANTKLQIAQIEIAAKKEIEMQKLRIESLATGYDFVAADAERQERNKNEAGTAEAIKALVAHLAKPKKIVRDPKTGKASGVE